LVSGLQGFQGAKLGREVLLARRGGPSLVVPPFVSFPTQEKWVGSLSGGEIKRGLWGGLKKWGPPFFMGPGVLWYIGTTGGKKYSHVGGLRGSLLWVGGKKRSPRECLAGRYL